MAATVIRTKLMHDSEDHPMRMILGFHVGTDDGKPISDFLRSVLNDLDMFDGDEICTESIVDATDLIKPVNIGKETDKFTLTLIYDNANFDIWIGVDFGYELVKTKEEKALYKESGAVDAIRAAQLVQDFTEFCRDTPLEAYGTPRLATLWCQ